MTMISAAVLLFLVMDPLGNVPMFISALKNVAAERQNTVIVRELLIALLLLVIFLFAGQHLLSWFHITDPALTVSGGVILFLIAIRMVFPSHEKPLQEGIDGEPLAVYRAAGRALCGRAVRHCYGNADDDPQPGTLARMINGGVSGMAGL
ncbi:MarC family protein [Alkanindiges illinoisensis]|uniref:MarC family protein n=1 Tax=Alkanindiges illinoisensis TaxID=197183 RepID=UPI003D36879C